MPSLGRLALVYIQTLSCFLLALILVVSRCQAAEAEAPDLIKPKTTIDNVSETGNRSEIERRLRGFRSEFGRAPTIDDLWQLLTDGGKEPTVSPQELGEIAVVFKDLQRPTIDKADLLELHRATRDSIAELHTIADIQIRNYKAGNLDNVVREVHEYAQDKGKLLLRIHRPATGNLRAYTRIVAYDGEYVRIFNEANGARNGSINPLESRSGFYQPSNLLWLTMLIDMDTAVGSQSAIHDLENFLELNRVMVFEVPRVFKGTSCLSVGLFGFEAWLDPARNFSLVRLVRQRFINGVHPRLNQIRELEDVKDFGNGIWFPHKVTTRDYDTTDDQQRLLNEEIVLFKQILVNKPIDANMFTDVIPAGSVVSDGVRGLAYIAGTDGSIAQMLDEALGAGLTPANSGHRILLITVNIVAVALIIGFILWRRYRSPAR